MRPDSTLEALNLISQCRKCQSGIIQLQFDIQLRGNFSNFDGREEESERNDASNDPVAVHHYSTKQKVIPKCNNTQTLHLGLDVSGCTQIKCKQFQNRVKMHSNGKSFNTDLKVEF